MTRPLNTIPSLNISQDGTQKEHVFVITQLKEAELCDHCQKIIWGESKSCFTCTGCGTKSHFKCKQYLLNDTCQEDNDEDSDEELPKGKQSARSASENSWFSKQITRKNKQITILVECIENIKKELGSALPNNTTIKVNSLISNYMGYDKPETEAFAAAKRPLPARPPSPSLSKAPPRPRPKSTLMTDAVNPSPIPTPTYNHVPTPSIGTKVPLPPPRNSVTSGLSPPQPKTISSISEQQNELSVSRGLSRRTASTSLSVSFGSQEVLDYNPPEPYATIEHSKPTALGATHPPGRQASASVSGTRPAIPVRTLPNPSSQSQPDHVPSPTGRMTNRVPTYYSLKLSRKAAQKHLSPRELARQNQQQNAANLNGSNGAPAMNEADKLFAYVVREIINTEHDYLNDLKLIVDTYIKPSALLNVITPEASKVIFGNIEQLIPISEDLVSAFSALNLSHYESICVGKIFLDVLPRLTPYTLYCQNQNESNEKLSQEIKQNKAFQKFLEDSKMITNRRDIHDFLIKPLQRITKYPLLLNELLKEMPVNHVDKANVVNAKSGIEKVVAKTNDLKRITDNLIKKSQLDDELDWEEYLKTEEQPYVFSRMDSLEFIKEGELKMLKMSALKTLRVTKVMFYLFNEILVVATKGDNLVKYVIPNQSLYVWNVEDGKIDKSSTNVFTLVRNDKKFKVNVSATSEADKQDWMNKITELAFKNFGKPAVVNTEV
eukprot:TRINITY_DN2826_c0_g1_i1.p1 TRINITY_DN2826_c0_g1~~TRINITY_DN2826_c0_g1_i1.p1  ORF type:complete len:733 (+),score=131.72 TRINITY_DN2826_c0_g1_i1:40-2199(+)